MNELNLIVPPICTALRLEAAVWPVMSEVTAFEVRHGSVDDCCTHGQGCIPSTSQVDFPDCATLVVILGLTVNRSSNSAI
jgi:hypothetical protein